MVAFCALELTVGLLTLAKLELLMTVLMIFLGVYYARRKVAVLVAGGVVCVGLYILVTPLVSAVRMDLTGQKDRGAWTRVEYLWTRIEQGNFQSDAVESDTQFWWARLNYANTQAFAMNEYDAGQPGLTFLYVIYTFVPRALWPDKPVIDFGKDFNQLILDNPDSQTGVGIFGEAYWNGGWILVLLTGIVVGLEFAVFTRLALKEMAGTNFRWLPCAFIGVYMGLRPDDWFVTIYVGQAVICAAYFVVVKWFLPDRNLFASGTAGA